MFGIGGGSDSDRSTSSSGNEMNGLEGVAQQHTTSQMIGRNTFGYRAGLLGTTTPRDVDTHGIADEIERLTRVDHAHATGVVDVLATQLPDNQFESGGVVAHEARDRLNTILDAKLQLDTSCFGVPRRDVDPTEARAASNDLLADATRDTFFQSEVTDVSDLAVAA